MTKSDIVKEVSETRKITVEQAGAIVDRIFDSMTDGLREGRRIELRGFGTFAVKEYAGYMGRNPKTGETVNVPPKRMPTFKMGKNTKEALNEK